VSFTLKPYRDFLWAEFTRERFLTAIAVFFVGLAALLAGVGVFGVLSYSVATRQRELGVRSRWAPALDRSAGWSSVAPAH
jgi:hypothetical protein